jgi:hypothetical protein
MRRAPAPGQGLVRHQGADPGVRVGVHQLRHQRGHRAVPGGQSPARTSSGPWSVSASTTTSRRSGPTSGACASLRRRPRWRGGRGPYCNQLASVVQQAPEPPAEKRKKKVGHHLGCAGPHHISSRAPYPTVTFKRADPTVARIKTKGPSTPPLPPCSAPPRAREILQHRCARAPPMTTPACFPSLPMTPLLLLLVLGLLATPPAPAAAAALAVSSASAAAAQNV